MKHFVITGGAGFIGSHLIRTLLEQNPGLKITCVDNLDPFYSPAIKQQNVNEFKKKFIVSFFII